MSHLLVAEPVFAFSGALEQTEDSQQCRFATTRWPHDGNKLAVVHFDTHPIECYRLHFLRAEDSCDVFCPYHIFFFILIQIHSINRAAKLHYSLHTTKTVSSSGL